MSSPKPQETSENEVIDRKSPVDEVSEEPKQDAGPAKVLDKTSSSSGDETGVKEEEEEKDDKERKQEETAQTEGAESAVTTTTQVPQHDWTAVYSPQYNAYYFYNTKTQETTWTNPLEASTSAAESSVTPSTRATAPAQANLDLALEGIDPELAYLDPSLAAGGPSNPAGVYAAKFNARTGRFTAMDGRDPSHLSEYERAKRMSSVFFDVNAWEQEVAKRKAQEDLDEAEGRRRKKKPSKADLERYKAQKEARKKTKYAWLRE